MHKSKVGHPKSWIMTSEFRIWIPNSGFELQIPDLEHPNPGFGPSNPGFEHPNPGFGCSNPGFGLPNPGFGFQNPGFRPEVLGLRSQTVLHFSGRDATSQPMESVINQIDSGPVLSSLSLGAS